MIIFFLIYLVFHLHFVLKEKIHNHFQTFFSYFKVILIYLIYTHIHSNSIIIMVINIHRVRFLYLVVQEDFFYFLIPSYQLLS